MEIYLAMHMYMCLCWGGVPSHEKAMGPAPLPWAADRPRPDTVRLHVGHTLSSQPPDHFARLQGVPEGEET